MSKAKSKTDEIADRLTTPVPRVSPIPPEDFLSTGSTLINLALSGHPDRGVPTGTFLYLVGDSGACKTWMMLSLFAEAARNKRFAKHRLIYDAPENGALMDVPGYFGESTAKRIVPPRGTVAKPEYSETVQQLYYNIDDALDKGPCVYVDDSMDGLDADEDYEQFQKEKKAHTDNKEVKGSYGMAKAKVNSKNINRVVQRLRKTGSMLGIISQTRDKIGGMVPGLKTRSGGKALKFYSHIEMWLSVKKPLARNQLGKRREYGSLISVDVTKNRINGWEGKLEIPFVKGYGIDDVGGMVRYLIDEHRASGWTVKGRRDDADEGGTVEAPEFEFEGKEEDLVQAIIHGGDVRELQMLCARVWGDIADSVRPPRPPRYT